MGIPTYSQGSELPSSLRASNIMAQATALSPCLPPVLSFVRCSGTRATPLTTRRLRKSEKYARVLRIKSRVLSSIPALSSGMVSRYQPSEIMTSRTRPGPYCCLAASARAEPFPPCVQRYAGKTRQGVQHGEKNLLLRSVRAVAQLQHKRRHKAQILFFRRGPEYGKVAAASEVHAAEMRPVFRQAGQKMFKLFRHPAFCVAFRHGQRPVHKVFRRRRSMSAREPPHAGFNHAGGQIGSRRLTGNAEKLFVRASPYVLIRSARQASSASGVQSCFVTRQIRRYSPAESASSSVMRCRL